MPEQVNTAPTPVATTPQASKPKAPILVRIIGWLLILSGIGFLLVSVPLLLFGGLGRSGSIFGTGGFYLVSGAGFIAVAIGLRNLKKWALYVYTGLIALSIIYTIYDMATKPQKDASGLFGVIFGVLILIYLWAVSGKFN